MKDIKASDRDVNRVIRSWLHEDRHEDVSRIAGAVLDQVDTIPQRRVTWWPAWRTPIMNKLVTYGLGVAAVVVLIFAGSQIFGSSGGTGTEPTPSATPESASAPPLTQIFSSPLHGYSVSYPEGWTPRAATEPWTASTFPQNFFDPQVDVLYDPTLESDLFLILASQPIGDSTPEDWVAEQLATPDQGCDATEPITVDGGTGQIGCTLAVVTSAGRGYWIQLYTGDAAPAIYDRAWFDEVLATVQLQPEDAVASAPPLTQIFSSPLHGYSVSYPEGWTPRAATEPWTASTFPQNFFDPQVDVLYDPTLESDLFLILASQPIGDSTPEDWVAEQLATPDQGCDATEPITVDGGTGQIGCTLAVVTSAGRGYWIQLYTGDAAPAIYDRAWFDEVLATVQLQPEDAVD